MLGNGPSPLSPPPALLGGEENLVQRFFALCSGELNGFSAPTDASALDVFKAALSAGQSSGVVAPRVCL